jgi:hypothetical protein
MDEYLFILVIPVLECVPRHGDIAGEVGVVDCRVCHDAIDSGRIARITTIVSHP